jgi:raffinose/stachyose/melibiose transport system substrate-binding protein
MKHIFRPLLPLASILMLLLGVGITTAQEPVTISLWTLQFSGFGMETIENIVAEFEAANPDIKVDVQMRGTDAHKEAVRVALNTPGAPDLFFTWSGPSQAGFYIDSGGVEPLTDYYDQFGWGDRFSAVALDGVTYKDVLYGVPYTVHAMGLYYRKDLFEQAGITSVPTTYDELIAANDKLVAAGITPLSIGGKFGWNTMRLLDSLIEMTCGAEIHDQIKQLADTWNQECVTAAYVELRRWVDSGYLPENFLGIDPGEAKIPVYRGEAAMLYEGDWNVGTLIADEELPEDWDFFVFPTGTGRLSFFVEMYLLSKNSEHKEEALRFADYWTSTDVQQRYLGAFSVVSPNKEVGPSDNLVPLQLQWADVINSYTGLYFPADQDLPNRLQFSYFQVQDNVIAGSVKPEDAAAAMQAEVEAYLQNPQ